MSRYRVYKYALSGVMYRHILLKRKESYRDKSEVNAAKILRDLEREGKLQNNLARSKRLVTDLILCNHFDYFCTFTFSDAKIDRYDFRLCQKRLSQFFNDFKKRYAPDFKYVVVPEYHKDGAIHFHGVVSGLPQEELSINENGYLDWNRYAKRFGFFSCSAIRDYVKCASYMQKYVTKDLMQLPKGVRAVLSSHGLERPKLVFDEFDFPMVYNVTFENEFVAVADVDLPETIDNFGWL